MDRRRFIAGASGALLTARTTGVLGQEGAGAMSYECRASIRQTAGPYLRPGSLFRSDIREDRPGVPLELAIRVVDSFTCRPASDCLVDVWHCDAGGLYSGFRNIVFDPDTQLPTDRFIDRQDRSYLRGHQVTGDDGIAKFTTIYPGWYYPRLTHIHVRVVARGQDWTTTDTQIYLPPDIEKAVFAREPYSKRGANPIDARKDGVVKGDDEAVRSLTARMRPASDGFSGTFDVVTSML